MAEQKQEHKRIKAIRRIFKWLGAVLLAIVLVLLLIFQAPWKAVIPLALFLAVYVALSYQAQKWLWLAVSVVLITAIVWIFLPDGDEVWAPFTLAEELAGHEAKYAIPENQNAAIIYDRLLQDYVPNEWRMRFLPKAAYDQTLSEPWFSRDYPGLTQWLNRHKETIIALPEACRITTCRFPSDFSISPADPTQAYRYSALKSWALMLLLSGNNDIAEGRPDEGFSKYVYALQIAKHLYHQQRTHDFLIGFGIEGIALPRINRFIVESNVSEEQLQLVTQTLGNLENNWSNDFSQCCEYDRLFVKNAFCSLAYQTNAGGRTRLSRDPAAAILGPHRPGAPAEPYWQEKSMKAYTMLAWFFLPSTPYKAAEMIDTIFEQYQPMAEPNFAWGKKDIARPALHSLNCHYLLRLLINRTVLQYDGFHDIYPKRLLQRRGTRVLIALREYNIDKSRWPEDLDAIKANVPAEALIDPQNNGSFVYKLAGETFTLYSRGKNGTDNDGRRSTPFTSDSSLPTAAEDDILFWPPQDLKAGEEDVDPTLSNADD
jgi:hypothetical protein